MVTLSCHNKCLPDGGKHFLVSDVLQSMLDYFLSTMNQTKISHGPKSSNFYQILLGNVGGFKGKHFVSWGDMFLPKEEGRIVYM